MRVKLLQIVQQYDVRTPSRSDGAPVVQAERFRRVQRRHANRRHWVKAFLDANAKMIVDMSFGQHGMRLPVVRAEHRAAAVRLCNALEKFSQVMAGRAFPQHHEHSFRDPFFDLVRRPAFMVAQDSHAGVSI